MAISFIAATQVTASSEDLTMGLPTGTIEDDVMVGFYRHNDNVTAPLDMDTFTVMDTRNDTAGQDDSSAVGYLVAGASEPSTYDWNGEGVDGGQRSSGTILTFRGVDINNPLDLAFIEAHYIKQLDDTTPTPPPITTINDNAWALVCGGTSGSTVTALGAPSGYTSRSFLVQNNSHIIVASKLIASFGLETPGAFPHTGIGATDDTAMYVLALRAAVLSPAISRRRGR